MNVAMTRLRVVALAAASLAVVSSVVLFLVLPPGKKLTTRVLPHADETKQGVIYGRVTDASRGNGDDAGQGGYTVQLLHTVRGQEEVDSETTTASDGTYSTAGPASAGHYVVRFTSPDASLSADRELDLQPGQGVRVDAQVAPSHSLLVLFPVFAY